MTMENCRSASASRSVTRALTCACMLGGGRALADTFAASAPVSAPAPARPGAAGPAFGGAQNTPVLILTPPGATLVPMATPVPNATPQKISPSVVMQSFYAGLSQGAEQSPANNSYYVRQSGLAGQSFGLLFLYQPMDCAAVPDNATLLPAPAIEICSTLSSHGSPAPVVAGRIHNADGTVGNATGVSFTNGLNATGIESGTVQLTTPDGFAIAFNYSAQACNHVPLLSACAANVG